VRQAETIATLTESDLDREMGAAQPIVVDVFAPGCRPCEALAAILDELAADYAGKLRIGKVRLDLAPGLAARFELKAVPTLIVFAAGEEKTRITGVEDKAHLVRELEDLLP
jgi:thioredoxin 1